MDSPLDLSLGPKVEPDAMVVPDDDEADIDALDELVERLRGELFQEESQLLLLQKMKTTQDIHQVVRPEVSHTSVIRSTQPPPLIKNSATNSQANAVSAYQQDQLQQYQKRQQQIAAAAAAAPQQSQQTLKQRELTAAEVAQRQATAKVALRKQLEQQLLQVSMPKAPPLEMNFVPSNLYADFLITLGLEKVVDFIEDSRKTDKKEVRYVYNPFRCSHCGTDFSPLWKREKPGSRAVVCESCLVTEQKAQIRTEHTSRLKAAFGSIAEQERELEQKFKEQSKAASVGKSTQSSTSAAASTTGAAALSQVAASPSAAVYTSQQQQLISAYLQQLNSALASQYPPNQYPVDRQRQILMDLIHRK